MPIDLTPWVLNGSDYAQEAYLYFVAADTALNNAAAKMLLGDFVFCAQYLQDAGTAIRLGSAVAFSNQYGAGTFSQAWVGAFDEVVNQGLGKDDVTIKLILEAMNKATFDELQEFIAVVDAYKSAVLPAPYNADYYAGFVRKFAKWV
jgi:hypothetical protein